MSPVLHESLHENEWLSLRRMRAPELGIDYVYSHETRCQGRIVACLPYRTEYSGAPEHREFTEFLLRVEVTPCWSLDPIASAVTGGGEPGEDVETTMLRELREETGFQVPPSRLLSLGTVRGTKSTDTVFHLFAAAVHGLNQGKLESDGSALEAKATVRWTEHPWESEDPLVSVMWARLIHTREWGEGRWWP